MSEPHVAIIGITGAVGQEMIQCLEKRDFPIKKLTLLASAKSAGKIFSFKGKEIPVQELTLDSFDDVDIPLFSAGGSISKEFAPVAAKSGAVVIDNSSAFRMDPEVPLIIPEINPEATHSNKGIIANPNCSTIQLVVALKPIQDAVGIERINVSTYQAVSGAGRRAIETLTVQTRAVLSGDDPVTGPDAEKSVVFNVVPKIDRLLDNGFTKEEMKMIWETQKILESADIMVNPTCARVPVFWGHSESIHLETRRKITAPEAQKLLNSAPGIVVLDGESPGAYPTAVTEAAHRDAVFVGRIREDLSHPKGLNLWVVSDNLRKGAALNAVQIAEELVRQQTLAPRP